MEKQNRKELILQYKNRKVTGGIYIIKNITNGKILLLSTTNLQGTKNRFEFSVKMGGCENLKLKEDWKEFGAGAFILEVLEELEKSEAQTQKEFEDDLKMLLSLWFEKFKPVKMY